jgi:hypothetical protein
MQRTVKRYRYSPTYRKYIASLLIYSLYSFSDAPAVVAASRISIRKLRTCKAVWLHVLPPL